MKLRGADDMWRVRVGDYRILYRIEDARRGSSYGRSSKLSR